MRHFPHGRWDREQPHVGEIVSDGDRHCWAECSCNFQGPPRAATSEADADMIEHEREVFERRQKGQRFVRGRVE